MVSIATSVTREASPVPKLSCTVPIVASPLPAPLNRVGSVHDEAIVPHSGVERKRSAAQLGGGAPPEQPPPPPGPRRLLAREWGGRRGRWLARRRRLARR